MHRSTIFGGIGSYTRPGLLDCHWEVLDEGVHSAMRWHSVPTIHVRYSSPDACVAFPI
uniref:Uncharacterized protein n=1 Tax=Oryza glumipatula TaxID=40148 RepID=A0A0E0A816_9ORYZ